MKTKMKTKTAFLLIMLMFIGFAANTFAQQPKKEKMEALKIAYITKRLNLTTEEAQKLWPIYNEYESKKTDINKGCRNDNLILKQGSIEDLTDAEAEQLVDRQIIHAQKVLDLRKEYLLKLKKVLSVKKVALLYQAERNFRKVLSDGMKDRKHEGPKDNKKNFKNKGDRNNN